VTGCCSDYFDFLLFWFLRLSITFLLAFGHIVLPWLIGRLSRSEFICSLLLDSLTFEDQEMLRVARAMNPRCPKCNEEMAKANFGRRSFQCEDCHQIIQFLNVPLERLPWSDKYER
jgi:hypothetical protein